MLAAERTRNLTVMEALKRAERYLAKHGVEGARLSAEHILARRMGCSRLDLYLRFDQALDESIVQPLRDDLAKRRARYPLQYILGEVEFLGARFRVREGVFIPRPETELLVERIEELIGAEPEVSFYELGTGAGVIAGSLALRHAGWRGEAVDCSAEAVALARENIEALGAADRVSVALVEGAESGGALGGLADARPVGTPGAPIGAAPGEPAASPVAADGPAATAPARPTFDLLVSNPPYVPAGVIPTLEEEVSRYEARAALDGGPDGLRFYPMLAEAGLRLVRSGGLVAFEIGHGQAAAVGEILGRLGYGEIAMRRDYNRLERIMTALVPERGGRADG